MKAIPVKHRIIGTLAILALIAIFVFYFVEKFGDYDMDLWMIPKPPSAPSMPDTITLPELKLQGASNKHLNAPDAWSIQVGSFEQAAQAQPLITQLRAAGYPTTMEKQNIKGKDIFVVLVGPEVNQQTVNTLLKDLKAKMQLEGKVVSYSIFGGN